MFMMQYYILLPFTGISLLSCISIIILCACSEFLRNNYPFKLIYFLSVIETCLYFVRIFPGQLLSSEYCIVQATLNETFILANILWIGYMSFDMYNVVIRQKGQLQFGYYKPLSVIFIVSALSSAVPVYLNEYGPAGPWCWISDKSSNVIEATILRLAIYYGICWIIIILNFIASLMISKKLKNYFSEENQIIVKKIKYYPFILMFIYIPMTVCRLVQGHLIIPIEVLIFSEIVLVSEGFLNVIVYGNNIEVKFLVKKFVWKLWLGKSKSRNGLLDDDTSNFNFRLK